MKNTLIVLACCLLAVIFAAGLWVWVQIIRLALYGAL